MNWGPCIEAAYAPIVIVSVLLIILISFFPSYSALKSMEAHRTAYQTMKFGIDDIEDIED